jgi:hypothetical protein
MSDQTIAKLNARGYWRVEVRPAVFIERRVTSIQILQHAIEKARVDYRGWAFPHIGESWDLPESQTWLGVETDWSAHVELWRAFLSGQFVYRGGVWTDWLDQHVFESARKGPAPKAAMPIVASLWSITEFWEFAARYSQTEAGDDNMFVEISFHGMHGRKLLSDHDRRRWFQTYGPARMDLFKFSRFVSRGELLTDAAKLAVMCTAELFATFGLDAGQQVLENIQSELLQMRCSS